MITPPLVHRATRTAAPSAAHADARPTDGFEQQPAGVLEAQLHARRAAGGVRLRRSVRLGAHHALSFAPRWLPLPDSVQWHRHLCAATVSGECSGRGDEPCGIWHALGPPIAHRRIPHVPIPTVPRPVDRVALPVIYRAPATHDALVARCERGRDHSAGGAQPDSPGRRVGRVRCGGRVRLPHDVL